MIEYILFVIGIFLLIKGADYLVDGSSSLAKRLRVPTLVIGLTVVAFGTSMPELVVNIIAAVIGYFLGFTRDLEEAKRRLNKYELEVVFTF